MSSRALPLWASKSLPLTPDASLSAPSQRPAIPSGRIPRGCFSLPRATRTLLRARPSGFVVLSLPPVLWSFLIERFPYLDSTGHRRTSRRGASSPLAHGALLDHSDLDVRHRDPGHARVAQELDVRPRSHSRVGECSSDPLSVSTAREAADLCSPLDQRPRHRELHAAVVRVRPPLISSLLCLEWNLTRSSRISLLQLGQQLLRRGRPQGGRRATPSPLLNLGNSDISLLIFCCIILKDCNVMFISVAGSSNAARAREVSSEQGPLEQMAGRRRSDSRQLLA